MEFGSLAEIISELFRQARTISLILEYWNRIHLPFIGMDCLILISCNASVQDITADEI